MKRYRRELEKEGEKRGIRTGGREKLLLTGAFEAVEELGSLGILIGRLIAILTHEPSENGGSSGKENEKWQEPPEPTRIASVDWGRSGGNCVDGFSTAFTGES